MNFNNIADSLLNRDPYMVLADYADYAAAQEKMTQTYLKPTEWNRMSLTNIAKAGIFASDRAINEYATNIWGAEPIKK